MNPTTEGPDPEVRAIVIEMGLSRTKDDEDVFGRWSKDYVLENLRRLLWDPEPVVRNEALSCLWRLAPEVTNDWFLEMVTTPNRRPFSLQTVLGHLGDHSDPRNLELLVSVAITDPNPDHRIVAIYGIGKIGDDKHTALLNQIARDDDGVSNNEWQPNSVSQAARQAIRNLDIRAGRVR